MYTHEIIDTLKKKYIFDNDNRNPHTRNMNKICSNLYQSQSFHLGEVDDLIGPNHKITHYPFLDEKFGSLRLPYKFCCFSYDNKIYKKDGEFESLLLFVEEISPGNISYLVFTKMQNKWSFDPAYVLMCFGKPFFGNPAGIDSMVKSITLQHIPSYKHNMGALINHWQKQPDNVNIAHLPFMDFEDAIGNDFINPDLVLVHQECGLLLEMTVILLNCNNIITEVVTPSTKRVRRRKKKRVHKVPEFKYHVLNVKIPTKRKRYEGDLQSLDTIRVHLCRGHWKYYTEERPLFGKYAGFWWWQPHVRGNKKKGLVTKDYNIITEAS